MRRVNLAVWMSMAVASLAAAQPLVVSGIGRFSFSAPSSTASELSGISYVSGNTYYAISDNDSKLYALHVNIDPNSSAITTATIDASPLSLRTASGTPYASTDFEGVAYNPTHNSVFVSDELGPTIHEQSLGTGNEIARADPSSASELNIFSNIRSNAGWESMARQADGKVLWTMNQQPLKTDGPVATINTPEPLRLQKLDGSLNPIGQYAYQLDVNDADSGWATMGVSCVSDLLALPNGKLVALERASGTGGTHGNSTDMRIRLYSVDLTGATDLAGGSLVSPTYVAKSLLWEHFFDASNNNQFEGITLGPTLANGDSSILLVADNGGGTTHTMYALEASGVPEPATVLLLAPFALLRRRRRIGSFSAAFHRSAKFLPRTV